MNLPDKIQLPVIDGLRGVLAYPALDKRDFIHSISQLAQGLPLKHKVLVPKGLRSHKRSQQRTWRLILPQAVQNGPSPAELYDAMRPLETLRQGKTPLAPLYYRHDSALSTEAAAHQFIENHLLEIEETEVFCLAGQPADLPYALQRLLSIQGDKVGRLCFDDVADYRRYVEKVLKNEASCGEKWGGVITTSATHDEPTAFMHDQVMEPIFKQLSAGSRGRAMTQLSGHDYRRAAVMTALSHEQARGNLWINASHGAEFRGDFANPHQGALVDAQNNYLAGELVREEGHRRMLDQGIGILLSCFGAGTPREREWAQVFLPDASPLRPPVDYASALPKALLAHEKGPLAMVAHVDMLFIQGLYSAQGEAPNGAASAGVLPLLKLCRSLLAGQSVGVAFRWMIRGAIRAETALRDTLQDHLRRGKGRASAERLALRWLRWHDASHWVILGDPLVRLKD